MAELRISAARAAAAVRSGDTAAKAGESDSPGRFDALLGSRLAATAEPGASDATDASGGAPEAAGRSRARPTRHTPEQPGSAALTPDPTAAGVVPARTVPAAGEAPPAVANSGTSGGSDPDLPAAAAGAGAGRGQTPGSLADLLAQAAPPAVASGGSPTGFRTGPGLAADSLTGTSNQTTRSPGPDSTDNVPLDPFAAAFAGSSGPRGAVGTSREPGALRAARGMTRTAPLEGPAGQADPSRLVDPSSMPATSPFRAGLSDPGSGPSDPAAGMPSAARDSGAAVAAAAGEADAAFATAAAGPAVAGRTDVSPAAPAPLALATPLGQPAWPADFAHMVSSGIRAGMLRAEIRVEPRDLGPISLQVTVKGNVVSVDLAAAHGATRSLIEQSLPALREGLQSAGMQLGGATVSGDPAHGSAGGRRNEFAARYAGSADPVAGRSGAAHAGDRPLSGPSPRVPAGRVDTFA